MTTGERVDRLCRQSGKTYADIAYGAGVTRDVLRRCREGRSLPEKRTLQKLADFFSVNVDDLIGSNGYYHRKIYIEQETEMIILVFIAGVFVGCAIGGTVMAMCAISKKADIDAIMSMELEKGHGDDSRYKR